MFLLEEKPAQETGKDAAQRPKNSSFVKKRNSHVLGANLGNVCSWEGQADSYSDSIEKSSYQKALETPADAWK